jgi:hypothetical protein
VREFIEDFNCTKSMSKKLYAEYSNGVAVPFGVKTRAEAEAIFAKWLRDKVSIDSRFVHYEHATIPSLGNDASWYEGPGYYRSNKAVLLDHVTRIQIFYHDGEMITIAEI